MATKNKAEPIDVSTESKEAEEASTTTYTLEPVSDLTLSYLNVLGTQMQSTITLLRTSTPGWADFLQEIMQTIGMLVQERKQ